VGLLTIKCAYLLGAERVIAIDRFPERLKMAEEHCRAKPLNYEHVNVLEVLKELTGGRGPDGCIDAVGTDAHGTTLDYWIDRVKGALQLEPDRPNVIREAIEACRKGGTVSIPGVYGAYADKIPIGAAFNKGLKFGMGQTHVQRYMQPLYERIRQGELDPSFIITHPMPLKEAPLGYRIFNDKLDDCIKIVLKPDWD
jgi:threonine dehydrogenase-like Zn-dependent dehydrogenase